MADKDDRPGGMLEISRSVEKDIEKWQQGKAEAPPIEHFLPDSALAEIERATKAREQPVRADQLIPISPAEAARRRTQHGDVLPQMPAQRRVIPAPFQRPRISAGSHGKTWQQVRADDVFPGDIVPGIGQVDRVELRPYYASRGSVLGAGDVRLVSEDTPGAVAVGEVVLLTGAGGVLRAFRPADRVQAFRKAV